MPIVSKATVIGVRPISDEIREYLLKPDKYINFEAGQFLQLSLELVTASDFWPESRTFSIASYRSREKTIRLFIKKVGVYTTKIFEALEIGRTCTIKYAYGDFTLPLFDEEGPIVCIAGGTGIAPFLAFVDALEELDQLDRLTVYYSVRHKEDTIDLEKLQSKIGPANFHLFTTREINDDTVNRRITIDDVLNYNAADRDRHYYICGSKDFTQSFKDLLDREGQPNIYIDEW
jgi:ferredoxin-NADP reductase